MKILKDKIKNILESKLKENNKFIYIVILIFLTIFACYPYLNHLTLWGHDMSFHLNRIIGISEGIKTGDFPVFINSNLVDGMGYSTSLFYPEIFLYIPAFFNLIGFGIGASYKLFIIVITFFTFLSMFYCINKIFNKKMLAIIASLLYTFSLYRLEDVFVRAALGEILAFVFLPIVVLGIYELIYGDKNKWYILSIGLFFLSCSHIISLFLATLLIIILIIFNFKIILKDKERLKKVLICGVFSLVLCCNSYLPMAEQILETPYRFSVGKSAYNLSDNVVSITTIFENTLNSSSLINSPENLAGTDRMNYGIGTILMLLPIGIFFLKDEKKDKKDAKYMKRKFVNQFIITGFFLIFAITEFFPWKFFGFMSVIQFPWRLNMLSTLLLSISSAYVVYELLGKFSKYKKEICIIFSLFIIYSAGIQLENSGYKVDVLEYNELLESLPLGAKEYLPDEFENSTIVTDIGKSVEYSYTRNGNKLEFYYNKTNMSKTGIIIVPLTYYKGYNAYIVDYNNNINSKTNLKVTRSNTGTIKIDNNSQKTGKICVEYKITSIQLCSYIITIISLIIVFIVRKRYLNNIKKGNDI